jgi:hypothetical protein
MSKHKVSLKNREARRQIARTVKRRLSLLIGLLTAILLVLVFKLADIWWPSWMIGHRTQIEGIILLVIILLLLLSPLIIEADSDPRPLDGPGKNPYNN